MIRNFFKFLKKQQFEPNFFGIFLNPFFFARRELFLNVKKYSVNINGRILDVGCGQKPYQHLFDYTEYVGMDIEQSGHDHTNEEVDVYYDGKKFPFTNLLFDSVICNEVLEHVFNPEEFLGEINRVLKSEGKLLLTVPFVWDEHEQPYDFARYSSFGLKFLLEKNGFEIIQQTKTCNDFRTISQLFIGYIYKKVVTKNSYINLCFSVVVFAPIIIISHLFYFVLPKNNDLYLDNIILAKKISNV